MLVDSFLEEMNHGHNLEPFLQVIDIFQQATHLLAVKAVARGEKGMPTNSATLAHCLKGYRDQTVMLFHCPFFLLDNLKIVLGLHGLNIMVQR